MHRIAKVILKGRMERPCSRDREMAPHAMQNDVDIFEAMLGKKDFQVMFPMITMGIGVLGDIVQGFLYD